MSSPNSTAKEVPRPDWLTEEFFREIYEKREDLAGKEDFQLTILSSRGVVDVGDNYCSEMHRVKVRCDWAAGQKTDETSFVVKRALNNPQLKAFSVFATEFEMYRTAISAFEEMWAAVGEEISFGPKCLKIVEGDDEILVMTDLNDQNYVMKDRFVGLDKDHTLKTLDKIAKFHATSIAFKEQRGAFGPRAMRKFFEPSILEMFQKFTSTKIANLANAAEALGIDQEIVLKIRSWDDVMSREMQLLTDPETGPDDFQVLCHGDLWLNNQLFRYDSDNKVSDVIFVDFQLSFWNRPHTDLFYFLTSSVIPEVLLANYDQFIKYYYDALIGAMDKLQVQRRARPTLKTLQLELLKNSFQVNLCMIGIVPIVMMDKSEEAKMDNFIADGTNDTEVAKIDWAMFHNPRIEKKLRLFLPFFNDKGILDSNEVAAAPQPSDKNETKTAETAAAAVTNGTMNGHLDVN